MSNAARRMYTRDGNSMLDVDDLISWAVDHYVANMQQKMKSDHGLQQLSMKGHVTSAEDVDSESSVEVVQYRK